MGSCAVATLFCKSSIQKKNGDAYVHMGLLEGTLKIGDVVTAHVDEVKRNATRNNHSATHLLNAALRKVLGPHVVQKGSLVDADRLRFDFSHHAKVTRAEITEIESLVNQAIQDNIIVTTELMSPEAAKKARCFIACWGSLCR